MGISKVSKSVLLTVAVTVLTAGASLSFAAEGPGTLSIVKEHNGVTAEYARAGSVVYSTARVIDSEDGLKALNPIELFVQVDGISIDATYDPASGVFHIDGHQNALFEDQKNVLQGMALRLEKRWNPYDGATKSYKSFLFRLVQFLSEAPAGMTIDTLTVKRPTSPPTVTKRFNGGTVAELLQEAGGVPHGLSLKGEVSDNDGITLLPCGCYWDIAFHDASPLHCFGYLWEVVGTCGNCVGRCGPGCGLIGTGGVYSWDCSDHDTCCGVHGGCINPFDQYCGDEYGEAADDFLFGFPNC